MARYIDGIFSISKKCSLFFLIYCVFVFSGYSFEEKIRRDDSIYIAPASGEVMETFTGSRGKRIILIQDCHSDATAQYNISRIIEQLYDHENISLVCLEGASSELDFSFYDSFPDEDRKSYASKYLLDKGLLSGPEYLSVTNPHTRPILTGAENKEIFSTNHTLYQQNIELSYNLIPIVAGMQSMCDDLAILVYPTSLIEFNTVYAQYKNKKISLGDFLSHLEHVIDEASIDSALYPAVSNICTINKREKAFDFVSYERQLKMIVNALLRNETNENMQVVKRTQLEYMSGEIDESAFLTIILKYAPDVSYSDESLQHIQARLLLLHDAASVDVVAILSELDTLIVQIRNELCGTDYDALMLTTHHHSLELIDELIRVQSNRRNVQMICNNPDRFSLMSIYDDLASLADTYRIPHDSLVKPVEGTDELINAMTSFYDVAALRDIALVENSLHYMNTLSVSSAILVAGGFHAKGITDYLREHDVSYTVVKPAIGRTQYIENYEQLMRGVLPEVGEIHEFLRQTLNAALGSGDLATYKMQTYVRVAFSILYELQLEFQQNSAWRPFVPEEIKMIVMYVMTEFEDKDGLDRDSIMKVIRRIFENRDIRLTTDLLLASMEARDPYTTQHCLRVAQVAELIGQELGLNDAELERLRFAGLLHDIGKMHVPREILTAARKLTADEYSRMQNHTINGEEVLLRFKGMDAIIPGVKYHHERHDGHGYPEGLSGEDIPLFARIIAVADTFDALMYSRAYRPARSTNFILNVISNGSGTQFDPKVVDAFMAAYEKLHQEPGSVLASNNVVDPEGVVEETAHIQHAAPRGALDATHSGIPARGLSKKLTTAAAHLLESSL